MTGSACAEALSEECGVVPAVIENRVATAGTFMLRRSHRINEIELSAEQQQALVSLIKGGDFDAKQNAISHNLRLVADIAGRYANRGVEFLDLVSEGVVGFIHALEKFELEGGFRFSAYARKCICENIERAIMKQNDCLLVGAG